MEILKIVWIFICDNALFWSICAITGFLIGFLGTVAIRSVLK